MTTTDNPIVTLSSVTLERRPEPWTPDELAVAFRGLTRSSGLLGSTLALALPSSVAPAIAVRLEADSITFRGHTVAYPEPDFDSTVTSILALVDATRTTNDHYAVPSANPASWPRLLRSGVRRVLFSATELFGLPFIAVDATLPAGAAYGYLDAILTGRLEPGPARCVFDGVEFNVVGEMSSVHLTAMNPSLLLPRPAMDPSDFGNALASQLGATLIDLVALRSGEIDYVLDIGNTRIVVTAGLEGGSAAVGYRGGLTPAPVPASLDLPEGWLGLGPATSEPGWVALHRESRIRALCTTP